MGAVIEVVQLPTNITIIIPTITITNTITKSISKFTIKIVSFSKRVFDGGGKGVGRGQPPHHKLLVCTPPLCHMVGKPVLYSVIWYGGCALLCTPRFLPECSRGWSRSSWAWRRPYPPSLPPTLPSSPSAPKCGRREWFGHAHCTGREFILFQVLVAGFL